VLTESSESDDESEVEAEGTAGLAPRDLMDFMRGFGHMRANDSGGLCLMDGMPVTRGSKRSGEPTEKPTTLR
jgi:hypothetical protein